MSEHKFDRGHSLSIFVKDRNEDLSALLFAFLILHFFDSLGSLQSHTRVRVA